MISGFTLQKETQGCNLLLGINSSTETRGNFVAALLCIASSTLPFMSPPVKVMPYEAEQSQPNPGRGDLRLKNRFESGVWGN